MITLCCVLIVSTDGAQLKQTRRVLILNDLAIVASPGYAEIDQAVYSGLQNSPNQIELYHESLQLIAFPTETEQRWFREQFRLKYSERKLDLIVAAGSASLKFITESREDFIRDTPIVFCGGVGEIPERLKSGVHSTGVVGKVRPAETLDAALRLLPGTKHVVVVGGMGKFDEQFETATKQAFKSYDPKLEFTYLTNLTMHDLLDRLRQLPRNTIVFHTSLTQDGGGEHFIDSTQAVPLVVGAANAPVFVMDDVDLRAGAVGGNLVNWAQDGYVAGDMGIRILNGEKPESIPIVTSTSVYMFDQRALKRWGLKESNLPPGSILLNRQPGFWELYKKYAIVAVLVFMAQALAIAALLWQRAKRKKTERDLIRRLEFERLSADLSTTFINLREEEVDANIERAMARLGEFFRLDRISLFEFSQDQKEMRLIFSWNTSEVSPVLVAVKTGELPRWRERLLMGEVSLASDVDALPAEAQPERENFRKWGIQSAASIPLKIGGRINGAASYITTKRRVRWTPDLVGQLQVIAETLWNALQRKRAETILRESEERFRLVASTAPVTIWMAGTDKLCTYVNRPWLEFTGRSLQEELGNGWTEGIHREDLQCCYQTYIEAFDRRESFTMEYRLRRHDGEYCWIFDHGVPRFNADGSFAGYIGSAVDVSERKKAEEVLSSVNRRLIETQEAERTRIARELHDDINQRLALVSLNLENVREGLSAAEAEASRQIEEIRDLVMDIVGDIQALSHRLHSSKLEYLGVVAACSGFCKELSARHDVKVEFHSGNIPKDLTKEISICLFRILQEALQNAIKHSGARHYEVFLAAASNEIHLSVHDPGAGFDPGTKLDRPGMGLTSMKERLKLVGGDLSIESSPEHGTTVHAHVPLEAKTISAGASDK